MNKIHAIFCLFIGIFCFCIFAYDIEYNRDFVTWMWLLYSILWFFLSLVLLIKSLLKENK